MEAHRTPGLTGQPTTHSAPAPGRGFTERRSTETKQAFKTTEFMAYVGILVGLFIAGLLVDGDDGGVGGFEPAQVWLYAVILTFGYMVSRGIAKSGSREPYDRDRG